MSFNNLINSSMNGNLNISKVTKLFVQLMLLLLYVIFRVNICLLTFSAKNIQV